MYSKNHLGALCFHKIPIAKDRDEIFKEKTLLSTFYCLLFILLFNNINAYAFNADSVYNSIAFEQRDTAILSKYSQLGYYFKSSDPDTAKYFFEQIIMHVKNDGSDEGEKRYLANAYLQIATIYQFQGEADLALYHNAKADSIVHRHKFRDLYAAIENTKGLIFYNKGEFDEAMIKYQEAIDLANEVGDTLFMAKVYSNMAIIKFYQGDYDDATSLFKQPVILAKQLGNKELLAGNLINVGLIFFHLGDMDSSVVYYHSAIETYKQINGSDGLLLCYKNLGCVYYTLCQYDLALETYQKSLLLAIELGDKNTMSKDYQNIGEVYMRLGDLEKALDNSLKAVRLKEEIGDKPTLATSYNSIGALHKTRGYYDEAIAYHLQALSIFETINHKPGIAQSKSNLAGVYTDIDSLGKAAVLYHEALKIFEEIDNKAGVASELLSLGVIYSKTGEFNTASQYINKSIAMNEHLGDEESIAYAYGSLLYIALKQGRYKAALTNGKKAIKIAERINALPLQHEASKNLSEIYKQLGNYKKALEYADLHQSISDSIYSVEKNEAMVNAEMLWQVERKESEIANLKNEQELSKQILARKKAENKRQKGLLISSVLLIFFGAIALILLRISYQRKRDLSLEKQRANIINLKMKNIKNRISPHFFFNALTAATVPLNDFPEHQKMYNNLIKLLKRSLENAEKTAVPLATELEIVNAYIALQQKKMTPTFEFISQIELSKNSQLMIPAMILQIPIENAIKHGLSLSENKRQLELQCVENKHHLTISIKDNGIGRQHSSKQTAGTGTGLKVLMQIITILNSQNKNKLLFKINDLSIEHDQTTGTCVDIIIPKDFSYSLNKA